MKINPALIGVIAAALFSATPALVAETGKSVVLAKSDLKWKPMGTSGVAAAPVSGDMEKGASRFYLKYPVGLVTPMHHHTANHHVTVISGSITLPVGGKETRLGPAANFILADGPAPIPRVEGREEAGFFIKAEGPGAGVMAK